MHACTDCAGDPHSPCARVGPRRNPLPDGRAPPVGPCAANALRLRANRLPQVHEPALADRRATGFEPIRITFDFAHVESNGEGSEQQQYIKDIINRSKEWLEQALKVPRLSGNLVLPADFECGDVPSVPAKYTSTGAANTDTLIFVLSESSSDPDHPCASGLTTQPRMTSARATRAQRERERERERKRERERERERREREKRERERARARERHRATESER